MSGTPCLVLGLVKARVQSEVRLKMSVTTKRVVVLATASALLMTLIVSVASAGTATSGRVNRGDNAHYEVCGEATIVSPSMSNNAYTIAQDKNSGCWNDNYGVEPGWIGANAYGYRSGTYCGSTGWAYNNSDGAWMIGVGAVKCSNPSGLQTFYTQADFEAWDPSYGLYEEFSTLWSPNQSG